MSSGAPWPGYASRFCPVCGRKVGTHREPAGDDRDELVVYHPHDDNVKHACTMSGKRAAIRAVAFSGAGA